MGNALREPMTMAESGVQTPPDEMSIGVDRPDAQPE